MVYKPHVLGPSASPSMDIIPLTLIICYFSTGGITQGEDDLYVFSRIPLFNAFQPAYRGEPVQTISNIEGRSKVIIWEYQDQGSGKYIDV